MKKVRKRSKGKQGNGQIYLRLLNKSSLYKQTKLVKPSVNSPSENLDSRKKVINKRVFKEARSKTKFLKSKWFNKLKRNKIQLRKNESVRRIDNQQTLSSVNPKRIKNYVFKHISKKTKPNLKKVKKQQLAVKKNSVQSENYRNNQNNLCDIDVDDEHTHGFKCHKHPKRRAKYQVNQ